ncbi:hypothetical protein CRE_27708 [Caenorhabditis remanei]|uniref:DUF19 domain-containing protein n=1 Tax=Caenorhabditis remanei TaxID=31234 RepID=E3MKN0_CAERE|nr:hypothetical protein CRE_27708 [Caenorhabditis remanei]
MPGYCKEAMGCITESKQEHNQLKAKKQCIENDLGKFCEDSNLKSFREIYDYASKFVGCPVH